MKVRDLLKLLAEDGWVHVRGDGAHRVFEHPVKQGHVSVSFHSGNADVPIGTLRNILKRAGLQGER